MKFDFKNQQGEQLSGRLEMPSGAPQAFALFAHCFTCSKDIIAASVISRKLTEAGLAVLRFDFTGLGNSDGDFANTNFSSNVQDLISAFNHLKETYQAPQILIGHSLGGAAVLKAAAQLPEIKAVVTLAAPSSVDHVAHLFENDLAEINEKGSAKVKLVGREFTIKKQFIDDIQQATILDNVRNFKKALLIMHSPIDNTVSIDHASEIFMAAKHPKSFVSLDMADHLLIKRSDAEYAARIIGAWVGKFVEGKKHETSKVNVASGQVMVKSRPGTQFTNEVITQDHHLVIDEPISVKGDNQGMTPYQMLLGALGGCTSMTMKMYCNHKGYDLQNVEVTLSHEKIDARNCEDCETEKGKVDVIHKNIKIEGGFTEEEKQRILEIAEKCPVNKTLRSEVKIRTTHT